MVKERTKKQKKIKNPSEKYNLFFDTLVYAIMILVLLVTLIPVLYVVAVSFTPYSELLKNGGFALFPKKVTLEAYKQMLKGGQLIQGMWVTVKLTVIGTLANLTVTVLLAYPLSRKRLPGRAFFMKCLMVDMLFGAGTVPTYMVVKATGLLNTFAAMIIPGLVSIHNLIIMKAFFENLPEELFDAARIDGCGEFRMLVKLVIPMSVPILLTIGMYYAVAHWNTYKVAVLYISDPDLQPAQVILRRILLSSNMDIGVEEVVPTETLRMAAVCFCTAPIVLVYPFIQKYFVKGTLAGAIKG